MRESKRDKKSEYALVKKAIAEDTARLSALEKLVSKLYEDMIADRISPDNFNALLQKSQAEQASLKNRVEHNTARIEEKEQSEDNSRWIELIREYTDVKELDAAILNQLIKRIVIHEDVDEHAIKQTVEIHFNFGNHTEKTTVIRE